MLLQFAVQYNLGFFGISLRPIPPKWQHHVKFAKYPNVGIYNDNIWKHWEDANVPASACDRELGPVPYGRRLYKNGQGGPGGVKDAYLVGEANWRRVFDVHSS